MIKKTYMKPGMKVVQLRHASPILVSGSNYGVNKSLQNDEVDAAW